jgi:hypothetical protein
MVARDGVTKVVVPVTLHGHFLATGQPSAPAGVFFTEVLGIAPMLRADAWVFPVAAPLLAAPHLVAPGVAAGCALLAARVPSALAHCVLGAPSR